MILTTTQIHKSFGDVHVLNGIDIASTRRSGIYSRQKRCRQNYITAHSGTLLKADSGDISIPIPKYRNSRKTIGSIS